MKPNENAKQRINVIGQYTDGPDELVLKANAESLHVLAERIRLSESGEELLLFVPDPTLVEVPTKSGMGVSFDKRANAVVCSVLWSR